MAVDVVLAFVWGALYVLERWDLLEGAGSRSRSLASVACLRRGPPSWASAVVHHRFL